MSEDHGTRWLSRAIGVGGTGMEIQALRRLLTLAITTVDAAEGSLLVWDDDIGELRFVATVGNEASEAALIGQRVPLGKGITGLAAVTREVQVGAPTYRDIRQTERLAAGPEAVVAAPLVAADRLLGVITGVTFKPGQRFGRREAMAYGEYASVIAVLLEQARRLAAVAALEDGADMMPSGTATMEREIVERLARLMSSRGRVLGGVARLLEAIEALTDLEGR
jgi:hypothetical protein